MNDSWQSRVVHRRRLRVLLALIALPWAAGSALARNAVIFVADGLRPGSVNAADAPTFNAVRLRGVSFVNSHALFPTFTTPNASAIATGHYLGDTGDFGNTLDAGYRLFETGNFGRGPATRLPFLENDAVLGDLDARYAGNYLGASSLLARARAAGYATAVVGKIGPTAIQDVTALLPVNGRFAVPPTILIDDATGAGTSSPGPGMPLPDAVLSALQAAGLPAVAPPRGQSAGDERTPGTRTANVAQQDYFVEATTRVVLPLLRRSRRPFVLVFWSRDPDGTQHNQGDSPDRLTPGINGPTSRAAVRNADGDLRRILDALQSDPALAADTDVFVTSDHGFATLSRGTLDAHGARTRAYSARLHYSDVPAGQLPPGFLAIDLAHLLALPLFDPDSPATYRRVRPGSAEEGEQQHPQFGNGCLGGPDPRHGDAEILVAANGGSDLIYLPHGGAAQARHVARALESLDYVGALFVDDRFGRVPGALPLSAIGLVGAARLPRPAIVVSFRHFLLARSSTDPDSLQSAVQVADTTLQQGQGMHGGFGRDNTFNFMAAIGPDFRRYYRDRLPVGNADIAPTLGRLLGLPADTQGGLVGRVLEEALRSPAPVTGGNGAEESTWERRIARSTPDAAGRRTRLVYQTYRGRLYLDHAERDAGR